MSLNDIAIVGAGGLGKEISVLIHQINQANLTWNVVGFYDDGKKPGMAIAGHRVLGTIAELNAVTYPLHVILGLGDPQTKQQVLRQLTNPHLRFPVLVHPAATIGSSITLGSGTLVSAGCRLTIDITVGNHVLLNLNTTIGHDVSIGDFTSIMPGVHVSGAVKIEPAVLVGSGATLLQNITIGQSARIGAGAVVTQSVDSGKTVIGIPAKPKS